MLKLGREALSLNYDGAWQDPLRTFIKSYLKFDEHVEQSQHLTLVLQAVSPLLNLSLLQGLDPSTCSTDVLLPTYRGF